jgi:hypothetical protein
MANNAFAFTALTGGAAGALDDLIHTNISDGDMAFVVVKSAKKAYILYYDSSSAAAEDTTADQIVVKPDSNSGNGRWLGTAVQDALWDNLRTALAATTLGEFLTGLNLKVDHIYIPASAMAGTATVGATYAESEVWDDATNDNMRSYLEFPSSADAHACFDIVMPSAWDRGTIKFKYLWTGSLTSSSGEDVVMELSGAAVGDNEDLDTNQGTSVEVGDALQDDDTDKLHISDASAAVTIANTPALGDLVHFKLSRDVSEESSSAAGSIRIFGIVLQINYTNEVSAW